MRSPWNRSVAPGMAARESRSTRGFTLVELLVAVGVVAVLTLGIGQIFGSVSKLVGTGAAVAEVDQMARTVEAQLRDDFESLNRMEEDETFLAIRNTRLGDFDADGTLDSDEIDIYLSRADEEADVRADVLPYERTPGGGPLSRAVTVRLDEVMFIGESGSGFLSYQGGEAREAARHALISYGHGLRPPLDEDDRATGGEPPRRLNYADGYFGARAGDDNRLAPSTSIRATGRNRYASDFVLTRQAMLLMGSTALGYNDPNSPPLLGHETEVAVFPRDLESSRQIFGGVSDPDELARWPLGSYEPLRAFGTRPGQSVSNPALVRHGRTDICALSRDGVQRWLEGGVVFSANSEGSPFATGWLTEPPYANAFNFPLWTRRLVPPQSNPVLQYRTNLAGLQSAIGGMLCRRLIETEPPDFRFARGDYSPPAPDPRDRRMDVHAILAEHCSAFEVAWSDGSTWYGGPSGAQFLRWDANGDGEFERNVAPGSIIWFDMDFTFRDLWNVLENEFGLNEPVRQTLYPRPNPDPEIGLASERVFDRLPAPNEGAAMQNRTHELALNVMGDGDSYQRGAYSTKYTQARFEDTGDPEAGHEYLAVWGFNPPAGYDRDLSQFTVATQDGELVGTYDTGVAWAKPKLIRVRLTLNDSQNRLGGGKVYEFIFRVRFK